MDIAKGTLEGYKAAWEATGRSYYGLRVIVGSVLGVLALMRRRLMTWNASEGLPKGFRLDVARLWDRFQGYDAELRAMDGDTPDERAQVIADVSRQLFRGYTRGRVEVDPDEGLGVGGSYTPATTPELLKFGSLLHQAIEAGVVAGSLNIDSAWEVITTAAQEAASDLANAVGDSALGQTMAKAFNTAKDAAKSAAEAVTGWLKWAGFGLLAYAGYQVYRESRKGGG